MAYTKTLQLNNGFSASYWRITKIDANKSAKSIIVTVMGYKDKATRDANGRSVSGKTFALPTESLDFTKDLFKQAYEYAKQHVDFFKDAVDA